MSTDYLFDRDGAPDAEVEAVEQRLAALRFDPALHPLSLPPRRSPRPLRLAVIAAAALIACGVASAAWTSWRLTWTEGKPWTMRMNDVPLTLTPHERVSVPSGAVAAIDIARIGEIHASPGTSLSLSETHAAKHRIALDSGSLSVRVWAPPGRFAITTPAGEVIDLGCVFDLSVDDGGTTRIHVKTGWVQMANDSGEVLVPAGTVSTMAAFHRPSVPVYTDAAPQLMAAVRAFETSPFDATAGATLAGALAEARPRDVITLLVLARNSPSPAARVLLNRAAALVPPPSGVSIDAIVAGNWDQLWVWYDSLDLPPAKNWWRNWRDALPRFQAN